MDTLRVIGYYPLPPFVIAQEKGFFAQEGLKIDFTIATLAPEHNKGMLEGIWDISLTSPDTMVARVTRDGHEFLLYLMAERGLEVKLIGAKGITAPAQLRGELLAGDPGDSNYDLHRRKILRAHGVSETEYAVKIIGTSPFRFEALRRGEVAACMLAPPYDGQALREGFNLLATGAEYIPDYATTACWARSAWVAAHRDKMLRFVRAFVAGADWVLDPINREEALRLVAAYSKISRAQAETKLTHVTPKAAIVPKDLNRVIQLRIEMGFYDSPHEPVDRFYDASVWCEATGLAPPKPFGLPRVI
jgi:ABC-type nitrate/sulfonate/bicarbonate transport system substrate-binding protein